MIHPDDAAGLGLSDGDVAVVSNHVGSVELPIEITEDIMPSVVSMPHGYGHGRKGVKLSVAAEKPGVSMNDLTDPAIVDDLSGNAVLNAVSVIAGRWVLGVKAGSDGERFLSGGTRPRRLDGGAVLRRLDL